MDEEIETMIENLQPVQTPLELKTKLVGVKGHFRLGRWIESHSRIPPTEMRVKKAPAVGPSGAFVPPPFTGLGSERFPMAEPVAVTDGPDLGISDRPVKKKITIKIDFDLFDDCTSLIDRSHSYHSVGQIIDQALRRYFSGGE
jgi:hypothetical protein